MYSCGQRMREMALNKQRNESTKTFSQQTAGVKVVDTSNKILQEETQRLRKQLKQFETMMQNMQGDMHSLRNNVHCSPVVCPSLMTST